VLLLIVSAVRIPATTAVLTESADDRAQATFGVRTVVAAGHPTNRRPRAATDLGPIQSRARL
nr:hypothetical protein [Planctomycetota bacterium]